MLSTFFFKWGKTKKWEFTNWFGARGYSWILLVTEVSNFFWERLYQSCIPYNCYFCIYRLDQQLCCAQLGWATLFMCIASKCTVPHQNESSQVLGLSNHRCQQWSFSMENYRYIWQLSLIATASISCTCMVMYKSGW